MDTMKLLLGATVALLLGALAVSWQGMTNGVKNTSPDEIARLKKQVTELRIEQDKLQLEKQIQQIKATPPPVATPSATEMEALKAQLEANKLALQTMEMEKATLRDAEVAMAEEGLMGQRDLEKADVELRRARMIAEALLIGTVKEYVEDAQYGGFITIEVRMPEQVQPGTILAIRRKTGILGQLKVSDVSPGRCDRESDSGFRPGGTAGRRRVDPAAAVLNGPSPWLDHDRVFVVTDLGVGLVEQILQHAAGGQVLENEGDFRSGKLAFRILDDEVRRHLVLALFFNDHLQGLEGLNQRGFVESDFGNDDGAEFRGAAFGGDDVGVDFHLAEREPGVGVVRVGLEGGGVGGFRGGGIAGALGGLTLPVKGFGLLRGGLLRVCVRDECGGDGEEQDFFHDFTGIYNHC